MNDKSDYGQLLDDAKSYVKTHYDLLRLELLDKLSVVLGTVLLLLVVLFLGFAAIAYLSVMTVMLLSKVLPTAAVCAILCGVFVIVAVVIYLLRDKIFINPMIRWLSGLLFKESENNDKETDDTQSLSKNP